MHYNRTALALIFCIPLSAAAAPKGAITLPSDQVFQSGKTICGAVNGSLVPGRKIKGGFFYPRSEEKKNLTKSSKHLSGEAKAKLLKKIKQIKSKLRAETSVCADLDRTRTPTPTTTPTATPTVVVTLASINSNLYYSEHSIYIIPEPGQVTFSGGSSWDSVYSTSNITSYLGTLKAAFPGDYFMAVITARNLQPSRVPNVLTYKQIASGIGEDSITDPTATNICRYHTDGAAVDGIYAVLDHEVGHNWGVFIGSELGTGHWKSNSTEGGQMHENYTEDNFSTIKRISGSPATGFNWTAVNNLTANETDTFSERDLYLQGLAASFPVLHVLSDPVYNPDGTMGYSAVSSYDQSWVEARNGVRNPDYRTSQKRFRFGFIYVARDLEEILSVYQPVERSIRHFIYADQIDTNNFRFQVPYLVATKFRGSINARLSDMDGNTAPSISVASPGYFTSSDGSAIVPFTATDGESTPTVSCVPASPNCTINGNNVLLSGLSSGSHFFTVKASDSGGKVSFSHFVVDVS